MRCKIVFNEAMT
jgi:hypothetical protein